MVKFIDPFSKRGKEISGGRTTSIVLGTNLSKPSKTASTKPRPSPGSELQGKPLNLQDDPLGPGWDPEAYEQLLKEYQVEADNPPRSTKKDE